MRSLRLASCLALAGLACGPGAGHDVHEEAERYAAAFCDALDECSCPTMPSVETDCEAHYTSAFELAAARELELQKECFDSAIAEIEQSACGSEPPSFDCTVLQGTRRLGAECTHHSEVVGAYVNECSDGLFCDASGRCQDLDVGIVPPPPKEVGADCVPTFTTSCGNADAYCTTEGVCAPRGSLGEECQAYGCKFPIGDAFPFCLGGGPAGFGTCALQLDVGATCDPLDWDPCIDTETEERSCDPVTRTCAIRSQAWVCHEANSPFAWR